MRRRVRQLIFRGTAAMLLVLPLTAVQASALRFCDQAADFNATEQDRVLRFSAIVKAQLERSGHVLALISRSGLDLRRFGVRYTHAGVSLKANSHSPWSVRQLYYACTEQRPRVFDQGLSGFLFGLEDPAIGFISIVLLPADAEAALERAVLDNRQALRLLGPDYSANAYAFSARYQNCNQWLAEMFAAAWGQPGSSTAETRTQAQAWLSNAGYRPTEFEIDFPPPRWLGGMFALLHHDDHPAQDLDRSVMRVSMPASLEAFVRARLPQAQRIEFCHTAEHVVIHHGWDAIADGCRPGPADTLVSLDPKI